MREILWGAPRRGLHNMPLFLGKSKGIFCVRDADCKIYENTSGADYTVEMIKGSFDMGHIGTPPIMAALERTKEYAVIGTGVCNYPPFYLIAEHSICSIEDLKGRTVSINKYGSCLDSVLKTVLFEANLPVHKVNIITLSTPGMCLSAIAKGDIQAAVLEEPWVSYAERVFDWHVLVDCPKLFKPSNYCFLLYARRSLVENQPDLVRDSLTAYKNSCEYAKRNIGEMLALDYRFEDDNHIVSTEDLMNALKREATVWNTNLDFDLSIAKRAEIELKKQGVIANKFHIEDYVVSIV